MKKPRGTRPPRGGNSARKDFIYLMSKTLGIIGGVGPLATAYFFQMIVELTDAATDQEHINILIHNNPRIPDRTRYILQESAEDPVPVIVETAKGLISAGAEVLALPCNTAHYFYRQIAEELSVPLIHIVEESVAAAKEAGANTIGVMATTGTVTAGTYQQAAEKAGLRCLLPSPEKQGLLMDIIYQEVKAGRPVSREKLAAVSGELLEGGCGAVILGCTELSLAKGMLPEGGLFIDSLEVLARRAIVLCGKRVRESR